VRACTSLLLSLTLAAASCPVLAAPAPLRGQVHPAWRDAYVLSFRSPDLLTNDPDERWGKEDGRLVCGGILSQFPAWLREQGPAIAWARREGRPVLLSLHVHAGFGTGLVTYTADLRRAEVANYPWLIRQLMDAGLGTDDVTVTVDTCNAQATAAQQIRPDLVPGGVAAWPPFARWRRADPARKRLPLRSAYRIFAQDHVRTQLSRAARGRRSNVHAVQFEPLTRDERSQFQARLFGPKGVIFATPAFFNVLRLGPRPRGTYTANLLTDRLETHVLESGQPRNEAEFRAFRDFRFLASAGLGDAPETPKTAQRDSPEEAAAAAPEAGEARRRGSFELR
jgi:hypothetical protein